MGAAMAEERRAHAMMFPFPCSGHINPTLKLAELLHSRGVHVTFVNTEHNHERLLRTGGARLAGRDGFRFESVPDGLDDADRASPDKTVRLYLSLRRSCGPPLVDLARRLGEQEGVPPVTCVVLSGLASFVLGVAEELGVPSFVIWGTSAVGFVCTLRLRQLTQRGYTPLKDESYLTNGYLDTPIDWIAGMPTVRLGDISSFVRTVEPNGFGLRVEEEEANSCARAQGLILNTFDELEPDVLGALRDEFPRVYTIGPLAAAMHRRVDHGASGLSLWEEDGACMAWLDAQPAAGSVLYVSFGSLAVLSLDQLAEFAWGLAASNRPFLWVVRPGLVAGDRGMEALPADFLAETKGRRFIAEWCAQEQVLRHRAVGGFLTHSGWNSTTESIWAGVPMICAPGFADQYINSRYVCGEWGVGLRLDEQLRREQVVAHIEELMGGGEKGEEMRRRAAEWKARAEAATAPGGSAYENLDKLVEELRLEVPDGGAKLAKVTHAR
ncbi:UDP-glycosyltransferase 85A7-like [Triticum urartu]|uniref:Glycosyltransferase n=1 Tax=Triticum urartu TaxID=4572 RepID=A0A8R7V2A5_TRIUA|nr:UDP-glycosyltransferase 85A7-like [Triticum urartu]XP_048544776.1 UDP-glycosyltransferase 85A7-like [Triticum urartu]XP_048544777.1 UDP-glycosyltransferase 85A7-like [Triticum urartu]